MAEHGLTVSVLEAGPRFSGQTALQNAEANAGKIMWSEPRGIDMNELSITLGDIAALAALADGIIPADERDAGAGLVHAGPSIAERMRRSPSAHVYVDGLRAGASSRVSGSAKMFAS